MLGLVWSGPFLYMWLADHRCGLVQRRIVIIHSTGAESSVDHCEVKPALLPVHLPNVEFAVLLQRRLELLLSVALL